jgi:hypothetical protein
MNLLYLCRYLQIKVSTELTKLMYPDEDIDVDEDSKTIFSEVDDNNSSRNLSTDKRESFLVPQAPSTLKSIMKTSVHSKLDVNVEQSTRPASSTPLMAYSERDCEADSMVVEMSSIESGALNDFRDFGTHDSASNTNNSKKVQRFRFATSVPKKPSFSPLTLSSPPVQASLPNYDAGKKFDNYNSGVDSDTEDSVAMSLRVEVDSVDEDGSYRSYGAAAPKRKLNDDEESLRGKTICAHDTEFDFDSDVTDVTNGARWDFAPLEQPSTPQYNKRKRGESYSSLFSQQSSGSVVGARKIRRFQESPSNSSLAVLCSTDQGYEGETEKAGHWEFWEAGHDIEQEGQVNGLVTATPSSVSVSSFVQLEQEKMN